MIDFGLICIIALVILAVILASMLIYNIVLIHLVYQFRYSQEIVDDSVIIKNKFYEKGSDTQLVFSGRVLIPVTRSYERFNVALKSNEIDQIIDDEELYNIVSIGQMVTVIYREKYRRNRFSRLYRWELVDKSIKDVLT